jgi:molybdenum cofactor cytidylyltransferase
MEFGTVPLGEAEGGILVHAVRAGGRLFKKGRLLARADLEAMETAGVASVTVVRLEPGDVAEDEAAGRIARALAGEGVRIGAAFTGRANLYAEAPGIVLLDTMLIEAANTLDESVTVATLSPYAMVAEGEMVATVKIIPFAAPAHAVEEALRVLGKSTVRLAPFRSLRAALISTELPGQKSSLLDKNRSALEDRLQPLSGKLVFEARIAHAAGAVAAALGEAKEEADIVFVFGASAITDRRDVIPAGIVSAGGAILHFGMPVDPGNLLLLGTLDGTPVIGLPSCARSPKVNGFDFVLRRFYAGLPMISADIMQMGVGGLLQEIPSRPQPRDATSWVDHKPRAPRIAAIVLAAGLSSRMGSNKLLADWRGKPLLRWTVEAALASQAHPVIVITGHDEAKVKSALAGLDVRFVFNPGYAEGLSASLRAGLRGVPADADGVIMLLGDMPEIAPALIDRMIAAFSPADGRAICVAVHAHNRGNPVLWARRFFSEIEKLSGDVGAKSLLSKYDDAIAEIEGGAGILNDIDTPDALAALRNAPAAPFP